MNRPKYQSPETENTASSTEGAVFIPKIVITGGPGCGKTTALTYIHETMPEIETVPEAASQVLLGGFPLPTDRHPWTPTWQRGLQHAVAGHQFGLEAIADDRARRTKQRAIVLDRGLLDGAGYLPGGVAEFTEMISQPPTKLLSRYHAVIYLGWLSNNTYETESNPARFEDENRARALSASIRNAWNNHTNLIEIHDQTNRAQAVAQTIDKLLCS